MGKGGGSYWSEPGRRFMIGSRKSFSLAVNPGSITHAVRVAPEEKARVLDTLYNFQKILRYHSQYVVSPSVTLEFFVFQNGHTWPCFRAIT